MLDDPTNRIIIAHFSRLDHAGHGYDGPNNFEYFDYSLREHDKDLQDILN